MAELHDRLNRRVLHINVLDKNQIPMTGDMRLVFQKNVFIDNVIGWRDETRAELRLYNFAYSSEGIGEFVTAAKRWLELPLNLLGSTFFSGQWSLGAGWENKLDLDFQLYKATPSKTDWFTVNISMKNEAITWSEAFHIDYTCLAILVEGLEAEI
jgi:hypothetical protein